MNSAGLIVLEPYAAVRLENAVLVPFLDVLVELVCNILLGGEALEVFKLKLLDALDGILGNLSQGSRDTAIGDRPSRSYKHDKVGDICNRRLVISNLSMILHNLIRRKTALTYRELPGPSNRSSHPPTYLAG